MGLVCGFGVNDADYVVRPSTGARWEICPAYDAWRGMIQRCYSDKFQVKNKTYCGVSVCDEWRSFMAFREWWIENHVDGWQLDKDLLSDARVYSPDTCIYVPGWLNKFTNDRMAARGDFPVGVYFHKQIGKFHARCSNPLTGKNESLGYFASKEHAHSKWFDRKIKIAFELKAEMDKIDARIYPRVIEKIEANL